MIARSRRERDRKRRTPLIGVTGPDRGGFPAWFFTRSALRRCGARAVRITPHRRPKLERLDGIVLGGGADVSEPLSLATLEIPEERVKIPVYQKLLDDLVAPFVLLVRLLSRTRHHGVDPRRDALELRLLEHARRRDLPVLGICRGAQLMNVAEGGSLVRHVQSFYEERPKLHTVLPRRQVDIARGSRLGDIVGHESLLVNSLHNHAVHEPGPDLRVVAREPSGVPQAIEHTGRRFWIGVQWHPEYLPQRKRHQRLFRALVEGAAKRRIPEPP